MQDIFGLDQRKSEACIRPVLCTAIGVAAKGITPFAGASRWQASIFHLGIVLTAAGLLVMILTALKSFGAAELLGQVGRSQQCCKLKTMTPASSDAADVAVLSCPPCISHLDFPSEFLVCS